MNFTAHPPERMRRSTTLLSAGCCCCCCCCVHSVGSLAGAIYGMRGGAPPATEGLSAEEAGRVEAERKAADRLAIRLYWKSLLIVGVISAIGAMMENKGDIGSMFGVSALVIAVFLPLGQLAASILALIYINVFPPARKPDSLRRLGRITLFSFIWGLIGAALTWVLAVSFRW